MTNFIPTKQIRSTCSESFTLKEAHCEKDTDCQNRPFSPRISGLWTGRCIFLSEDYVNNTTFNITKLPKGLCEFSGELKINRDKTFIKRINCCCIGYL